ncbi:MAG: amidase [Acidobacteria bacterium]|nr:amidase [Acidobacteriota bacterium]
MKNDNRLTIASLATLIRRKKISPVQLTQFCLDRISLLQPSINAYITVTAESALRQARQAEKEIVRGDYRGMLHGIPISLKDIFHTKGIRTTAGSRILNKFVPSENAVVVERLLSAGSILLGKTNMHEFAYGPTNLNPHYGHVRNPWDTSRMSGGSSGGSAASVVTAQAIASFGTDTGGSIRIPAAACGCVGLKPTYGRISSKGVIPLAWSLDHPGPLARSVRDAAILFDATAEPMQCGRSRKQETLLRKEIRGLRIGIPRQYFFDRIHPEVRRAVLSAAEVFEQSGARVGEVNLKGMEETAQLAAAIVGAEAVAYHDEWMRQKPQEYGYDVISRLELTREFPATRYIRALQKMTAYRERLSAVLNDVDVLLAPTLPIVAPPLDVAIMKIGRAREDVLSALLRLTRPGNLSGLPSISVPCGFSSDGLPVGLQLIGKEFDEATLLSAAFAYESATDWHTYFPPDIFLQ